MIDLKSLRSALEQLEEERNIPKEKIIGAIEDALTAAYKKDYGKKGQIVRAKLDFDTGTVEFSQVKIVVDESTVRMNDEGEDDQPVILVRAGQAGEAPALKINEDGTEEEIRPRYNEEHHILLDD
ncbi:MAG: NusA N-terminal domain-containing protein, partial [Patescibacteria group bacterium]